MDRQLATPLPRWIALTCVASVIAAIAALSQPWQEFCSEGYAVVDRGFDRGGYAAVLLLATAAALAGFAAIRPARQTWITAGSGAMAAVILVGALELVWVGVHALTYSTHARAAMPVHAAAMLVAFATGALILGRALRLPPM